MMTEPEVAWYGVLKQVVERIPQAVQQHGWKNDPVGYIAATIAKEKKDLGVRRQDVYWTIVELIEAKVIAADFDSATHTFSNLKVVDQVKNSQEAEKLRLLVDQFKKAVEQALAREKTAIEAMELAKKQAAETRSQERVVEVQLKNGAKTVKKTKGIFHKEFEKLLKLAKNRMPIFAYGPTGSGKTFIFKQLADSMGLEFGYISCTAGMSEAHILGRAVPNLHTGKNIYQTVPLVTLAKKGGIFLFDEICASDPNLLLTINTMMSNRMLHTPANPDHPYVKLHDDFFIVAADNTLGTGGDRMYAGRSKLDASTLDRFGVGKVFLDYDPQVEAHLCPDDELRNRLLRYRRGINANRLERAMSTRFMEKAYDMIHAEDESARFTVEDVEQAFFMGWKEDEMNKVKYFQG